MVLTSSATLLMELMKVLRSELWTSKRTKYSSSAVPSRSFRLSLVSRWWILASNVFWDMERKKKNPTLSNIWNTFCYYPKMSIWTQKYRMDWVKHHLIPISLLWTGAPFTRWGYSDLHPTWPLTLLGDGPSTTPGNLFQCLIILTANNFFLLSDLNLLSFSLNLSLPVLTICVLVKSLSPSFP